MHKAERVAKNEGGVAGREGQTAHGNGCVLVAGEQAGRRRQGKGRNEAAEPARVPEMDAGAGARGDERRGQFGVAARREKSQGKNGVRLGRPRRLADSLRGALP